MNTIDDFLQLVHDRLGLPVSAADAERSLQEIPGWDSMHLLWLLTTLEQQTGRRISMPDVLAASSLGQIYLVATKP